MEQDQSLPIQLPAAPFPAPPPFWKYFTTENEARLKALRDDHNDESNPLPLELACLTPPPPPSASADSYTVFSIPQSLSTVPVPPPEEILLFDPKSPSFKPANLLTRLTKSLLLNFLELTTILGNDATQYAEKMADINRLMLNVHFVINLYRPHQAREGVKEMLEKRLNDGKKEIEDCDAVKARVEEFLHSFESVERTQNASGEQTNTSHKTISKTKASQQLWSLINTIEDE